MNPALIRIASVPRARAFLFGATLALLGLAPAAARAVEYLPTSATASSALPGWPSDAAVDGNPASVWSSSTYASANHTEWYAFWHDGFQDVNYVRMSPRFFAGALGFPRTFSIYWSDGASWRLARTVSNLQTPYRSDDLVLALPSTVRCNGILISASVLGADNVGNYVFQMSELRAGYDPLLGQFSWVGNDGSASRALVQNVGSQAFDPSKIGNWNPDARNPILVPNAGTGLRNIYAPSVVKNGGAWNIYFGGWDNSRTGNDELSLTVSADNFASFGSHVKVLTHGVFTHVNNESVLKLGPSHWQMAYTTYAAGGLNRPGYATSSDGLNWTPGSGSAAYLQTMSGYPAWKTADVNGGNVPYYDGSQYHMYWVDMNDGLAMNYATSPDNLHYTYVGTPFHGYVPQNLISFVVGGARYFLSAYHNNGAAAYYSLSTSIASPAKPSILFAKSGSSDAYITSIGLVSDGARLYGALYGASAVSSLDQNRIFATWLQRRAIFTNASTRLAANQSLGPDQLYVLMTAGESVETGQFSIYDSDGTTLLMQTPRVTLLAGDIWRCNF